MDQPLARLTNIKREKTQMAIIRNKIGYITTYPAVI